jgi:uncharacterized iron-regulated membrane protein
LTRARRLWLQIHRWLGLSAGVVLVVVGLSGSFLAFYTQIDRTLNADWVTTRGAGRPLPMSSVLEAARPAMADRFLHSVFPPADAEDVHHVWFTPSAQDQSVMWEVLVDPYSGKLLGSRTAVPTMEFTRRNIANTIYTLHFQLFMGDAGSTIVGFAGLFLLLSGISGLVLWWPRGRSFRTGLRIKQGSPGIRLHFDLHRVAGIYSVAVLLVVAFTGVYLTFPAYVKPMVNTLAPVRAEPQFDALPEAREPAIDADAAMKLALAIVPGARVTCLWLPGASGQTWRVSLRSPDGVAWAGGPGDVWLHPKGGQVLGSRTHAQASAGEVFIAWQLPLHGGSAFGLPGRVVACVLGLVPLLMAVTGTVIWWRKRRARRFHAAKPLRLARRF